jgi:hypothetical protein
MPRPGDKALLKLLGIQPANNAPEGVMGGDTTAQIQKRSSPFLLGFPIAFDVHPIIGTTNNPQKGDPHEIDERMFAVLFLSWVFDIGKIGEDARFGQHGSTFLLPLSFIEIAYAIALSHP